MVAINTIHCIIKAFFAGAVSWGTVSSSAAHSAIAEAPPWHKPVPQKEQTARLSSSLLGNPSVPTGHWALGPGIEAQKRGDTLCFSAGEPAPLHGWPGGRLGRGSWQEEAGPVPCSSASWAAGPGGSLD